MVICTRCGAENQPGRIFCGACSAKLDMTNFAEPNRSRSWRERWYIRFLPHMATPLVLLMLLPFLLTFWAQTEPLGRPAGTRLDAQRVVAALEGMRGLEAKRRLETTFTEGEINAFFKHGRANALGYESITVDAEPAGLQVRLIKRESFLWMQRPVSYDVMLVPAGPLVRPVKARKGKSTLWGGSRHKLVRTLHRQFSVEPEWAAFAHLKSVTTGQDLVVIEVRRE